ncbi:MAG: hypothetical protein P8Y13_09205 [Deinococcales bacterium]
MLTLRPLDAPGRRAYLDALRPRVLVVRVRGPRRRFVWAVPMAPFEELLAFALALVLLVPSALRLVPARARGRWLQRFAERPAGAGPSTGAAGRSSVGAAGAAVPGGLLGRLSLIAAGGLGDALRVPPGTPYLTVETRGVAIDVRSY